MSHPTYVGGFQLRAGVASSARQQRTPWALFLHPAPFQAAKRPAFCTVQRAAGSRGSLSGAAPDRGAQAAVISPQAACPSLAACGSSAMEGRPRRNISAHASKRSVDQPPARRTSGSSWRRPRPAVAPRRRSTVKAAAVPGAGDGGSMSEGEEGDLEVSRELERFDVERFRQKSAQLDLMWNVEKKPKPQPCDCCQGSGHRSCEYCHGTGAMMVGNERFCSLEQGCKVCPVCNGTGEVKCLHCNGTGFRAAWLEPGCPLDKP